MRQITNLSKQLLLIQRYIALNYMILLSLCYDIRIELKYNVKRFLYIQYSAFLNMLRPLHEAVKHAYLGQFPFFNLNSLIPELFFLKKPSFWQTYANNSTISFLFPAFIYFLAQLS